jgi:hypothetical protein
VSVRSVGTARPLACIFAHVFCIDACCSGQNDGHGVAFGSAGVNQRPELIFEIGKGTIDPFRNVHFTFHD